MGRIGQRAATPVLLEMFADPDTTVAATAAFALGLLRDPAAVARLRSVSLDETGHSAVGVQAEAVSALSRIGGPEAARAFADLLNRSASAAGVAAMPPP